MGEFFFPGFLHTENFNVKMQHDTGKWVISINCDCITVHFLHHNTLRGAVRRLCLKRQTLSLPKTSSLLNSLASL